MSQPLTHETSREPDYFRILWQLALAQRVSKGSFEEDLNRIAKVAADTLKVQRVSLWAFRSKASELECLTFFDASSDNFSKLPTLYQADYPQYFQAILEHRFIDANDAITDTRTREFTANYLRPNRICSMLDLAIFQGTKPKGLLCLEHVGQPRTWNDAEKQFASSLADLAGLEFAERENEESQNFIQSGLENAAQAVLICNAQGSIQRVNTMSEKVFGYSREQMLGLPLERLLPGTMTKGSGALERCLNNGKRPNGILIPAQGYRANGEQFPVEFSISRLEYWQAPFAMIILSDISQRHLREQALASSEALYRGLVEDQEDYIIQAGIGGKISFANTATCKAFGLSREQLKQHTIYDFLPEHDHMVILAAANNLSPKNPVTQYMQTVVLPDHSTRQCSWLLRAFFDQSGAHSGYQAIGRDMTEELSQQEKMKESQRLESLAVMAGGMAHDFNNLLTPILSFTDMAQTSLPRDRPELKYLEYVMKSALRARDLIRMVLIFSKREEAKARRPISAGSFLREIQSFIRTTSPTSISFIDQIDLDCGVILANPTDLFQILSNLCTNAVYAMPAGGTLIISASQVQRNGAAMLQLEIIDTGCGIEPDTLRKMYNPFYTTKPPGEGTGLGLPVIRSLTEELGGEILCKTEPGHGTAFAIYLPIVSEVPDPPSEIQTRWLISGTEHILIIDDEPFVAGALRGGLEQLGYTVTVRSSANEALTTFRHNPMKFDAVITDYTMPFMTGIELSAKIRSKRHDIPIILMSGYGQIQTDQEARAAGIDFFLSKPFVVEELASTVRLALDKDQETPEI